MPRLLSSPDWVLIEDSSGIADERFLNKEPYIKETSADKDSDSVKELMEGGMPVSPILTRKRYEDAS